MPYPYSEPESRPERDSVSWNLEEDEIQRRRNIFWEFHFWDCWAVSAIGYIFFNAVQVIGFFCRAFYMGVLLCWISLTRIVDFHEILTHTSCHLASRSLAVSNLAYCFRVSP